jgi:hypothetical protein
MSNYKTGIITIPALLLGSQLHAVTLGFFPSTANVTAGSPFSVDLRISDIDNNTAIGDYDFDINFSSSVLSIGEGDVTFGNQLQQSGVASLQSVNIGNGQLNISEVSLNDQGVLNTSRSDEVTVARLNFTAGDTPGVSQLGISVNALGNQNGSPVSVDNINPATIRVEALSELTTLQRESSQVLSNVCSDNQGALNAGQQDLTVVSCGLAANTGGLESEA